MELVFYTYSFTIINIQNFKRIVQMNKKRIGLISGLFLMSFILITSQTILPATAVAGRGTLFGTDASGTTYFK